MLTNFLSAKEDGVFYIGHASAIARLGGKLTALDPIWKNKPYGDYWEFHPNQVDCDEAAGSLDFCVVSHIHADHCCEDVLTRLARGGNTRFAVMAGREPLQDKMMRCAAHPRAMEPFKWVKWMGQEFYFVPHAFNSVDSSCFLRNPETGYTVYHGNDNFLSMELIEQVRPDIERVDVAMVPYAFIHWYPFLMNMPQQEKRAEIERLNRQSLNQAYQFVDAFKPVHTIPFGSSMYHIENVDLNKSLTQPEDFNGALQEMRAGGYILGHTVFMPPAENPWRIQMSTIVNRVAKAQTTVAQHQIVVAGETSRKWFMIDLEHRTVSETPPNKNYTRFDFKEVEFRKWLAGEITFEQAIGTRQFTCTRMPNLYNLEVFEWMNRWL